MERLRYVARAGGGDPAAIVAETVEAIVGLRPEPSELVPLCRNLLERHPACGPLWWLCAHLLADPATLADAWSLVEQVVDDPTSDVLAQSMPEDATVMVVGHPRVAALALCERPDLSVLAVEAGDVARGLVRRLDRAGVIVDVVAPEAMLGAARKVDLVLVEAEACSDDAVVSSMGSGLATVAACHQATPIWLVAGRGRRLPSVYVGAIAAMRLADFETFSPLTVTSVAGPDGAAPMSRDALAPECPAIPELARVNQTGTV